MKPKLIDGNLFADDRGYLSFVNDFKFDEIKRFYMVENHQQGFVRAWHAHEKEGKYVYVVSGAAMVCTVPIEDMRKTSLNNGLSQVELLRFFLSNRKPQILYIPAGYANGFKTLEKDTKIMFFSTSTLQESKDDDFRFDWFLVDPWQEEYR